MRNRRVTRRFVRSLLLSTTVVITAIPCIASASDWTSTDVGNPALAGSAVEDATGVWTVQGGGADIWGTADGFHYLYRTEATTASPSFEVKVRIDDLENTDQYAKAGIMFRTSLNPDAATVLVDAKPNGEVEFMVRSADGGAMEYVGGIFMNYPMWLDLTCLDVGTGVLNCFPAVSQDGNTWNPGFAPNRLFHVPPSGYLVGLAVTSHNDAALTTAHVRQLSALSGYSYNDIGNTGIAGNAAQELLPPDGSSSRFTIQGAGADIWGTADSFAFVHGGRTGSALALRYRVVSVADTNPFAKAGLMIRDGLASNAPEVIADVKPNGELEFMARTCADCPVNYLGGAFVSLPAYVALTKNGNTFTVQAGSAPASLTTVGSIDVPMADPTYGFAVTSHDPSQLTTAVLDGPWQP